MSPHGGTEQIGEQIMPIGGPVFVSKWSEKQLSDDMIGPIEFFRDRFSAEIVGRFAETKLGEL